MTRTWDENRVAINQLWPMAKLTDEERRLWHDTLGGLDQATLYDAVREVKRARDTLYPQLKWVLDVYRELAASRKKAMRPTAGTVLQRLDLRINEQEDARLAGELVALIDVSTGADFASVENVVLGKLPSMHSRTAIRVLCYARRRLLGEEARFGRVTQTGDVDEAWGKAQSPSREAQEAASAISVVLGDHGHP